MKNCFHSEETTPLQHATASSYTERVGSGITSRGSTPTTLPKPSHSGQAPIGLLKLNISGLGSWKTLPSASKTLLKVFR